jgi:FlaA1/EpsC-like NDP-sugar epimerase
VPVVAVSSRERGLQKDEWSRLIPGQDAEARPVRRKAPQSVRVACIKKSSVSLAAKAAGEGMVSLLIPAPLRTRTGWKWLRAMASDWALISLNWLLAGTAMVALRILFPEVRCFGYAAGAPSSLLGMAVLQTALITLVGYSEGLHAGVWDVRQHWRVVVKSVFLATSIMSLAYLLQGGSRITAMLACATAPLHVAAMCFWRWSAGRYESASHREEVRNVLIVGAGGAGRRVSSYVEQSSARDRKICGFLDDDRPLGNGVLGRVSDLARIARREFVDEVILAAPRHSNLTRQVLNEAKSLRLDVEIVPDLPDSRRRSLRSKKSVACRLFVCMRSGSRR